VTADLQGRGGFEPSRLTIARQRRCLTKTHTADKAGVSVRSITAYEAGDATPSPETMARLGRVLRFPVEFFERDALSPVLPDDVSFRALSRLSAGRRDQALAAAGIARELSAWLDNEFVLPEPDVPALQGQDVEQTAAELRKLWDLGDGPIANMVHLLESHGIRVFSLADECREVDAFSFVDGTRPYVLLNTLKSAERSRFDAAHELAHVVLRHHSSPTDAKSRESEADRFASAFLMPRSSIQAQIRRKPSGRLGDLLPLKQWWRVSLAAYVRRLHDVGELSDWQYRSYYVEMSKRGYRTTEPHGGERETSQLMMKVLDALRGGGSGPQAIARALDLELHDLRGYMFGLLLVPVAGGGQGHRQRRGHVSLV
jgi:Zn-dependent peptidase ImmA (M78 family)/DNA-binding XRE family transcriptional regulator